MQFGEKLRSLRASINMTQKELADKLSISPSAIGMYEQNRRVPDTEMLLKIAFLFNVTTDYLLGISDIKNSSSTNPIFTQQILSHEKDTIEGFQALTEHNQDIMIGRQLKQLRTLKKKSQQEVCSALNIEQSTLANYENDRRVPKIDILLKLADYYQCSLDQLLGRTFKGSNILKEPYPETLIINSPDEEKLLTAFRKLNEDNKDILIGEAKKALRDQGYIQSVAADEPPGKTGTDMGK